MECVLCVPPKPEAILWRDVQCRIVDVGDAEYVGYCRVIWRAHVREVSDLPVADRNRLMHIVFALEHALRELLHPTKINLAALGNQVPHLHWHVIPRFDIDPHFPDAIWAPRRRTYTPPRFDIGRLKYELSQRLLGSA